MSSEKESTTPSEGVTPDRPSEGVPGGEARHEAKPLIPNKMWVCPGGGECRKKTGKDKGPFFETKKFCESKSICTASTEAAGAKGSRTRKRKPSAAFLEASARWRAHLAEYRKAHPGQSLKQQMRGAKKTYKKSKSQPISVRNTQYSVQVRPRTKKASRKKTKRPKKRTGKKKRSFFGF